MPDRKRLNMMLAYNTVKYVSIQDRRLGCLYYFLVFLVFVWVVGFQIWRGNEHYKLFDVKGSARMTIQQPTKDGCNPRKNSCEDALPSHAKLPYCKAYEGARDPDTKQGDCIFADMVELIPQGMSTSTLFIPTRLDRTEQKRGCAAGKKECDKLWTTSDVNKNTFVAGIEDYTVMLVSSFVRKGIRGVSRDKKGFYYECQDKAGKVIATDPCEDGKLVVKPIDCLAGLKCDFFADRPPPPARISVLQTGAAAQRRLRPGRRAARGALEAVPEPNGTESGEPFAIHNGDVFRLGKLMELAGVNLDHTKKGHHNESIRMRGVAVSVQVEYTNLRPWGIHTDDVGYIYRVIEQQLDDVKKEVYATSQPPGGDTRVIENRHGILLHAEVSGSFGEFNVVYLLVMLTTSLALLSGAQSAVDALAMNLPTKHKRTYRNAKYEEKGVDEEDENE